MNWFRKHLKFGSRLALFALTLQFVLSFGHLHFNAAQAAASIQNQTDLAQVQSLAAEVASQAQQWPASHDEQPSNEPCAICAVMAMADQIVFVTAALLLLPDAVELLFLAIDAEFVHLNSLWSAFQSRAPPVS
jgi:hypothetical protein